MKMRKMPQDYSTIKEMFLGSIEKYSDKVGFLEKRPGNKEFREITYKEFGEDVIALGVSLVESLGLEGKRIAVIGENSYEWAVSYFSVVCGAGIVVPIDKELPANEIENLVRRSEAEAIFYSPRKKEAIEQVKKADTSLKYYIEMYPEEDKDLDTVSAENRNINELIALGKTMDSKRYLEIKIDPEEFKILLFTSGTTQEAKGVMLTNKNIMSNLHAAIKIVHIYDGDRFFSVLPLHHSYESSIGMLIPIYNGLSIAYAGGLKSIANDLKETHPTIMLVVPALIENLVKKINKQIEKSGKEKLVDYVIKATNMLGNFGWNMKRDVLKDIHDALGGKVRLVVSAAAPIDPAVGKRLEDFGIMFVQGYGLTETSPLSALVPFDNRNMASVGIAAECCEIKINEPNEEGIGEVFIKGENVTQGYYKNEEETKKSITDGWFHSGDLGYMDKDGFLYLTGRSKNLIITGNGKNVYPEEIENLINKIPYVNESLVYAAVDPKDKNEQIIAVKVTLDEAYLKEKFGASMPSDSELHDIIWQEIKEVNHTLVPYKWIKELEIKKEDFVKTTTMKIKRYEELKKK